MSFSTLNLRLHNGMLPAPKVKYNSLIQIVLLCLIIYYRSEADATEWYENNKNIQV